MVNDTEILAAIASFLNGNPTVQERDLVVRWLEKDKQNKMLLDNLMNIFVPEAIDKEALDSKERIYLDIQERITATVPKKSINLWKYIAAASVIIAIIFGGVAVHKEKVPIVAVAQIQTLSPIGAKSIITLPDGSVVELNAGSELTYPAYFNGDIRKVSLRGEAYFEVSKDEKHPFIVEASDLAIKVLGTHFNIIAYDDDENIITTLLEGSISVRKTHSASDKEDAIILKPNQQLIYNRKDDSLNMKEVDSELYVLWKDGQYYFENEKFSDIVKKLERGFGVKITIGSAELETLAFSGVFPKNNRLEQILNAFKKHRNFDYKRTENGIIIFKK